MARTVENRATSPANELRDALDEVERMLPKLNPTTVQEYLVLLDRIDELFDTLPASGVDLRSEEVRWESIQNRLEERPDPVVAAANQAGGLEKLRSQHPPATGIWWHLDAAVMARRRRTLKRMSVYLGALVAVVAILYVMFNWVFPPDPVAVQLMGYMNRVDELVMEQRWEQALALVQEAKEAVPESEQAELWIWEAVLYERLGDTTRAAEALAAAQKLTQENPTFLWVTLGNRRLFAGDLDGAEAAAQEVLTTDPENAQAYFLRASVAEAKGDTLAAVDLFNKTFELAEASDPQLAVLSRVRMGMLLQRGASPFDGEVQGSQPITDTLEN